MNQRAFKRYLHNPFGWLAVFLAVWFLGRGLISMPSGPTTAEIQLVRAGRAVATAGPLASGAKQMLARDPLTTLVGYVAFRSGYPLLVLRAGTLALGLLALLLMYWIAKLWLGKRAALVSMFMVLGLPWIFFSLRLNLLASYQLVLTLLAVYSFDRATRSERPTAWYSLAGLSLTALWLNAPVAVSLMIPASLLLLATTKRRWTLHISRQASLTLLIMGVITTAISAVSWYYHTGFTAASWDALLSLKSHVQADYLAGAAHSLWHGPASFTAGLPGQPYLPSAILVLGLLGGSRLLRHWRRPRNRVLVVAAPLLLTGAAAAPAASQQLFGLLGCWLAALWAAVGLEHLLGMWHYAFPTNQLARPTAAALTAAIIGLGIFSTNHSLFVAWWGSPDAYASYATTVGALTRAGYSDTKASLVATNAEERDLLALMAPHHEVLTAEQLAINPPARFIVTKAMASSQDLGAPERTLHVTQGRTQATLGVYATNE